MEKEEIQTAKTPETDQTVAPGNRAETRTADQRWILALQRSAGNRAVATLLAHAPRTRGVGRVTLSELPLQRKPDGPPEEEPWPEEPVPRPILWPEEAEGERNEPCFDPDSQAMIGAGVRLADAVAAELVAMPPDLETAVKNIAVVLNDCWGHAGGSAPGQTELNEAMDVIQQAGTRVSAYVAPVSTMLEQLASEAQAASGDAREAASTITEPASADEKPEPCFEEAQQALIGRAVLLTQDAVTELRKRPPDYPKALATLRNAANMLGALGGAEPGQAKLKGAVERLNLVVDSVRVYLTPVATVLAEAAMAVRAASAQAREAADMAKPGPSAAGGGAQPPEAGGYG